VPFSIHATAPSTEAGHQGRGTSGCSRSEPPDPEPSSRHIAIARNQGWAHSCATHAACTGPQTFWGPKFSTLPYIEKLNRYAITKVLLRSWP
jgi:hypothetical protein